MAPDIGTLAEAARALAEALHIEASEVVLNDRKGRPKLVVPLTLAGTPPEPRDRGLSKCVTDILLTLEESDSPLTTTKLLLAMAKKGREWGKTTVETHLQELMADGTIENVQDGKLRGYRVPS